MENRVIKVGMLGLGTVGTGVYKVLKSQESEMEAKLGAKVELKKIPGKSSKSHQGNETSSK